MNALRRFTGAALACLLASLPAQAASYMATGTAYAAYATPTDMLCIHGSATKTVSVSALSMTIGTTAAAMQTIYYVRYSVADTGGTASHPTPIAYDANALVATATLDLYSVIPVAGTPVGNLRIEQVLSSTLTTTPALVSLTAPSGGQTFFGPASPWFSPVILRGTAQVLCLNYNGAALTAGFAAGWLAEWSEF